jgi:hypothetical protein
MFSSMLGGSLLLAAVFGCSMGQRNDSTKHQYLVVDKSESAQQDRKKLIDDLQRDGLFTLVQYHDPGSRTQRVWVSRKWQSLSFAAQENYAALLYGYYFDGTNSFESVIILDDPTGDEIARYSAADRGLKLF